MEATRLVVGHRRVKDKAFTNERTLQVILTLDQLFFLPLGKLLASNGY
jgi:hypothetical protein